MKISIKVMCQNGQFVSLDIQINEPMADVPEFNGNGCVVVPTDDIPSRAYESLDIASRLENQSTHDRIVRVFL